LNIIFATQNKGKAQEVKNLFASTEFKIFSLADLGNKIDIEETGETLYQNALIKAKAVYDIYKVPVVADDSGIMIEQLDGRPGVYSARYAGENCTFDDNNKKVIEELDSFPEPHKAKFVSHAIYYDGLKEISAVGELHGIIIKTPRGTNGFGYDPIFIPDGFDQTISEMTFELKNKISHRAGSFNKLRELITKD
jgi:XTP/dITP diphosphohydrolase